MSERRPPIAASELVILGEHRGLLFVDKPAGLQTEPDARHSDTLVTRIAKQLAIPVASVHALSRLDTGVSGVVTLGLTTEARRLVTEWRGQGRFVRRYLALATGDPVVSAGEWTESIGRASGNLRRVGGRNAEVARTSFVVISSTPVASRAVPSQLRLLALSPRTGRTHQLRVHAAAHGLPLLGDRAYGGASRLTTETGSVRSFDRIALHAAWVELPLTEPQRFEAVMPQELTAIWQDCAGDASAFAAAARVPLAD